MWLSMPRKEISMNRTIHFAYDCSINRWDKQALELEQSLDLIYSFIKSRCKVSESRLKCV